MFYFKGHIKSILQLSFKRIRHYNVFQAAAVVRNYNFWGIKSDQTAPKSEIQVHYSSFYCAVRLSDELTWSKNKRQFPRCFHGWRNLFLLIVSEFLNNLYHQSPAVKAESVGRMPFADKVYFKIMLRL